MQALTSSVTSAEQIRANLAAIEDRIVQACARAGRDRSDVLLVAVSKTFEADAIDAAVAAGVTDIGENRVQEFRAKAPDLASRPRAHLIGHLQSNKAKEAAALFDVVQTIDSVELAQKLGRYAAAAGKTVDVLVQVNVGEEPQKSGVASSAAMSLAAAVREVNGVAMRGFMTIPPVAREEETRHHFRLMRALAAEARERFALSRLELSMGMSDDFEIAIEEGATMIRLGRAIFGHREKA